jgi:NAD(P)-dependent dehydrogenase (short-subunit alcohol dehydrogenase family)
MVRETVEGLGGLDVLVNNAGIQISRPSDELSSADFDKVIAVNLRGAFLCAREAIRHFLAEDKPGSILNVSSVHQLIPKPSYLGYSASKGGMQNLTRTLALEYASRRILSGSHQISRPWSRRVTASRGCGSRRTQRRERVQEDLGEGREGLDHVLHDLEWHPGADRDGGLL